MGKKARDYKRTTLRRLDTLSGNECAAPDCDNQFIAKDEKSIISKICHIEAASKEGPRFNPAMDDDERRHYDNLILLCDECHTIIDNKENETQYPVPLLQEWKKSHENKAIIRLNSNTSLLRLAIDAIADTEFDSGFIEGAENYSPFNLDAKISYNMVVRNRPTIDEYKVFYPKISSLYDELEARGSFKKERLLRNVHLVYLKVKGKYLTDKVSEIEVIRANADNIIEDIEELLMESDGVVNSVSEDISFGISVVMVDAFMRCKILEEPEIV